MFVRLVVVLSAGLCQIFNFLVLLRAVSKRKKSYGGYAWIMKSHCRWRTQAFFNIFYFRIFAESGRNVVYTSIKINHDDNIRFGTGAWTLPNMYLLCDNNINIIFRTSFDALLIVVVVIVKLPVCKGFFFLDYSPPKTVSCCTHSLTNKTEVV